MSALGVAFSASWIDMRSLTTRSMRSRPTRNCVLDQLAVGADAAVAEVVDVVRAAEAVVELDQVADDRRDVLRLLIVRSVGGSMPIRLGDGASFLLSL